MAVREIKTTLAVDGERAFNKAVTEAGRNMRVMASEMKSAAADFNLTGDEMEYLGRKSKSLNSQIAQQEAIIKALEGAVEDSAKAYGDASAKTDGYRIKLNNANASLSKLRKELEDNDQQMREMGNDAGRVGRQLEQGIGEAADDVSKKIDSMVNTLDEDLGDIGKSVDFSAFKDKFDMTVDVIGGVNDALTSLTEGTEDYRRTMSFLEQNAITAGMDPQIIKDMTFEVSALTGELDGAVEGMSNLMAAGFEEDELALAVDRLKAAVIQFPDTLKFESLADSLQESVSTQSAVGQYAEYLERMGVDLETVNKSFEEAAKKGPEAVETVALAWLSNPNAEAALEMYEEMNADLIAGKKAQQEWNDEVARTAEILQPCVTKLTEYKTELLGLFNEAISGEKTINGKEAKIWWLPDPDAEGIQFTWIDEFMEGYRSKAEAASNEISEWLSDLFNPEDIKTAEENAGIAGENIATQVGNGIVSAGEWAISKARELFQAIASELNKPVQGPTIAATGVGTGATNYGGQSYGGNAGSTYGAAVINLDGKKVGEGMVDYNSSATGKKVERASTYLYGGG